MHQTTRIASAATPALLFQILVLQGFLVRGAFSHFLGELYITFAFLLAGFRLLIRGAGGVKPTRLPAPDPTTGVG